MQIFQMMTHGGNLLLLPMDDNYDNPTHLSHEEVDKIDAMERDFESLEALKSHSHNEKFDDNKLQFIDHKYYKTYILLKWSHWCSRVEYLANEVLVYCDKIDKLRLGRQKYIENNNNLEIYCLDVPYHV